jgi:hypothetical protein
VHADSSLQSSSRHPSSRAFLAGHRKVYSACSEADVVTRSATGDYTQNSDFCLSNRSRRLSCIAVQAKLLGTKDEGPDILPRMENRSLRDVGGTPGGLGSFLFGFAMACVGGYLLANQVSVIGSYWSFYGGSTFGITLLPLLIGVGILFWSGKNIVGWLLTIAGALFILAGVIANMHIYFRPTSLFNTLVMLILFVGGLGLIARALMPQGKNANE